MKRTRIVHLSILAACAFACGDDEGAADSGVDGGPVDMFLPPGPQGDVLRVPESERWVLPTLQDEVYVLRTEANVPHIYAHNEHDLRVVQGFVVARDRYFQIEAGRRLAQGRLSELVGEAGLAGDEASRGRGMRQVAERLLDQLSPEDEAIVDAYVEGVNAYVQAVRERRADPPSELQLAAPVLGARNAGDLMEDLTRADLIAFAAVPVFQLGFEADDPGWQAAADQVAEAFRDDPLRRGGVQQDIWDDVAPLNDVSSAAGFGLEGAPEGLRFPRDQRARRARADLHPRDSASPVPSMERGLLRRVTERNRRFEELLRGGVDEEFGSNAWAVSAEHAGGAAILAGDGHLPLSVAPLFYQLGLDTQVFGAEGGPHTELMGLFFAGIPPMAVGTNGKVAWSQTYLRGDITDWYAEELTLDEAGRPEASRFDRELRTLVTVDEVYTVAEVEALGSVGRTETWTRYETFDGRLVAGVEGRPVTPGEMPEPGESIIHVQGQPVIPSDIDGDGIVSAVSFDYTGFDVSNLLGALRRFNDASDVGTFRAATRELVAYAQNLVVADAAGDIYYGSYNATPSRAHLPRDEEGRWVEGANPRGLIDGTQYPAFQVPLDAEGFPDESACTEATAERCLVPFDRWPSSLSPERGYVLTANNDIGHITTDGDFFNDEYYLGGPWNNGFRARTIQDALAAMVADDSATVQAMSALQGNHDSVMARRFGPALLQAVERARILATSGDPLVEAERRLADAYEGSESLAEATSRLQTWLDRGAVAASGVATFYDTPDEQSRDDAVATMIFNEWWRRFVNSVFGDEDISYAFSADASTTITRSVWKILDGRGEGNRGSLASFEEAFGESVFFDDLRTTTVRETSDELLVGALGAALQALRAAPSEAGVGGFGTADMDQWLWGLRHRVRFESIINQFVGDDPSFALLSQGFSITTDTLPLAPELAEGDPRSALRWFPRPGDLFNVDAAHWRLGRDDYEYANGPVMRMVIRMEPGAVRGVNILPGGQSGRTRSPHFADQAALWLGNETIPLRFEVGDVVAGATARETYSPR